MDDFVEKPFCKDELLHCMNEWMEDTPPVSARNDSVSLRKRNVLIVEGALSDQMAIARLLRGENCMAHIAGNAFEALELMKHNRYDLVLMDYQMPLTLGMYAVY